MPYYYYIRISSIRSMRSWNNLETFKLLWELYLTYNLYATVLDLVRSPTTPRRARPAAPGPAAVPTAGRSFHHHQLLQAAGLAATMRCGGRPRDAPSSPANATDFAGAVGVTRDVGLVHEGWMRKLSRKGLRGRAWCRRCVFWAVAAGYSP